MTFADWKKSIAACLADLDTIKEESKREWQLGDVLLRLSVHGENEIYCGVFDNDTGQPITDVMNRLTADQSQRMFACRKLFEQWVAGEADDLPTDPPAATVDKTAVAARAVKEAKAVEAAAASAKVAKADVG